MSRPIADACTRKCELKDRLPKKPIIDVDKFRDATRQAGATVAMAKQLSLHPHALVSENRNGARVAKADGEDAIRDVRDLAMTTVIAFFEAARRVQAEFDLFELSVRSQMETESDIKSAP